MTTRFSFKKYFFIAALLLMASAPAHAEGFKDNLDSQLGIGFGLGQLGNSKADLKNRNMEAFSVDGFLGYKTEKLTWGVHLNYLMQEQLTSVSSAGGTNLKGHGLFLGLAAKQSLSEKYYLLYALDFFGHYDLDKDTSTSEDDELRSPLMIHVRGGGFMFEKFPQVSLDAEISYSQFKSFHIAGTNKSWSSQQTGLNVYLTYHFGSSAAATSENASPSEKKEGP